MNYYTPEEYANELISMHFPLIENHAMQELFAIQAALITADCLITASSKGNLLYYNNVYAVLINKKESYGNKN